ncbi:MAG: hypothetical protein RL154_1394 [Pseudomonadota bacterium]|jgi:AAA15 family ATPase/GTPase
MLLQFSVNNFRSIKDTVTFSMLSEEKNSNINKIRNYKLLQSAVLYGANASGKSNIFGAMSYMASVVLNKPKIIQSTDELPYFPFRLSTETEKASSSFEIVFFIGDIKYRYGFEADNLEVYAEWLFADTKGREAKLFYRDSTEQYINTIFKEGIKFFDKKNSKISVAKNQLLLWKCDQNDGEVSKTILQWFKGFNVIDGLDHNGYASFTIKRMEDSNFRDKINDLVKTADVGIELIATSEEDIPLDFVEKLQLLEVIKQEFLKDGGLKQININTYHKKYNENHEEIGNVIFELDEEESLGTRKFFKISAPIIDTLNEGKVLVIDELDASLHPMLTRHLIKLFNSDLNKKNAQLIFATHDTSLLTKDLFTREQIWLTEKNRYGATDLYSLLEIKDVRAKEDFEKYYLQGKYGAIPYLGKFEF